VLALTGQQPQPLSVCPWPGLWWACCLLCPPSQVPPTRPIMSTLHTFPDAPWLVYVSSRYQSLQEPSPIVLASHKEPVTLGLPKACRSQGPAYDGSARLPQHREGLRGSHCSRPGTTRSDMCMVCGETWPGQEAPVAVWLWMAHASWLARPPTRKGTPSSVATGWDYSLPSASTPSMWVHLPCPVLPLP
jgi:hypothetical protein